jgi:RNA polymerase sigma-70 factor, ECF subfamily
MAIERPHIEPTADDANREFGRLAEPFRREVKLHCYRMLGSLHDAEDLVQETYLRAWRSLASFDGGSMRAWLYKIATNACLNALESRKHAQRFLPDQLRPASAPILGSAPATEIPWLEPYPDAFLEGIPDDEPSPETRYSSRESVQLAFVAAIQQLPPRQRAALMLCDVLGWKSAEAATLLDSTTASINSALQRAREALSQRYADRRAKLESQPTAAQKELLERYMHVWEGHDVDSFVALLKEDATAVMPPWLQWFAGRDAIGTFFSAAWKACGGLHLIPTSANCQPAFAAYEFSAGEKRWKARSIHVLTLENELISKMTVFVEPGLFRQFGFPQFLPQGAVAGRAHPGHVS